MISRNIVFILCVLFGVCSSLPASGQSVSCRDVNALDDGKNCRWRLKGNTCCCWCPDPTGAHSYGHVMDLRMVVGNEDVYFEIKPGAGDARCVTKGYMYYSLDGKSWTLFWSKPNLKGWTKYSDMVHIDDSFRYIRANTDGCSVDWCKVQIGGGGDAAFLRDGKDHIGNRPESREEGRIGPAEEEAEQPRKKKRRQLTEEERARLRAKREARKRERERLKEQAKGRAEAEHLRKDVQEKRERADSEEADRLAKESYSRALQKLKEGDEQFERQAYLDASQSYRHAAEIFLKSIEEAGKTKALPSDLVWRDGRIFSARDGAELILIREGSFIMGSASEEGSDDEHPPHRVHIDSFYMEKYEVAIGQYKQFLLATGHVSFPDWISQGPSDDRHPVVGASWEDAAAYAAWAGRRLPTEAEWEYACRAGTTTRYSVGDTITHDDANYAGTGGRDQWEHVAPAGSFPPNEWGLCDMHGNVWEWCADRYAETYYKDSPIFNPQGPLSGDFRVVRGGSWRSNEEKLRSSRRESLSGPETRSSPLGFRSARDLD